MSFNKKAGTDIGRKSAQPMIDSYQKENPKGTKSVFFGIDMIKQLISVEGIAGVSVFFAKNEKKDNTVVLLPIDLDGNIIGGDNANALEVGTPCPPYCPK